MIEDLRDELDFSGESKLGFTAKAVASLAFLKQKSESEKTLLFTCSRRTTHSLNPLDLAVSTGFR